MSERNPEEKRRDSVSIRIEVKLMLIRTVRYNQVTNLELLFGVIISQNYYGGILSMLDTNQKQLYILITIIFWLVMFFRYLKNYSSVSNSSDS